MRSVYKYAGFSRCFIQKASAAESSAVRLANLAAQSATPPTTTEASSFDLTRARPRPRETLGIVAARM
jgi:hypothetical protein